MGSIQDGPHYEIPSAELADWLDVHASDTWWYVDGDPLLTGRMPFPCPTDELSSELRKINRLMLVEAPKQERDAKGQLIGAGDIEPRLIRYVRDLYRFAIGSEWGNGRYFYLCWKGSAHEWLLAEDRVTAEEFREEATT